MLHNEVVTRSFEKIVWALSFAFLLFAFNAGTFDSLISPTYAASAPYMVKNVLRGTTGEFWDLAAWGDKLAFKIVNSPQKNGLWLSDGTKQGTARLKAIQMPMTYQMLAFRSRFYFVANDGVHGFEPWVTDGTPQGTLMLTQITPGKRSGGVTFLGRAGNLVLYGAAPEPRYLWILGSTNGTPDGTHRIADVQPVAGASLGTTFMFAAWNKTTYRNELWKTDGTSDGTMPVKDVAVSAAYFFSGMWARNRVLWFFATDESNLGLWQSDGTEQGTGIFKALGDKNALSVISLARVQDTVFFVIRHNPTQHYELWHSDYTPDGTRMIHDFVSGSYTNPLLYAVGSKLLFAAADGTANMNLWSSDGTPEGTVQVAETNIQGGGAVVGDKLYFPNADETLDMELWQSDGTPDGTYRVANLNAQDSGDPHLLTAVKGTLFFTADDGIHGRALWAYKP